MVVYVRYAGGPVLWIWTFCSIGNETIETERLTVPHYQMHVRNFVLCPLYDIAPDLTMPDGRTISGLVHETGLDGLQPIAENYPWF